MSYTKNIRAERTTPIKLNRSTLTAFKEKAEAFRSTLFPSPLLANKPNWDNYSANSRKWEWPILDKKELQNACSATIKGKTPGPDYITQEIITHAYKAIPTVFYTLYASLLDIGYHPKCWRQATGAVLKKPAKPDYLVLKAYRVISLLNCLGKISERILAQRLAYLAETTSLLHPT